MTIQFIEGRDAKMRVVAVVPGGTIAGITTGMEIEIGHHEYKVGAINVIVSRRQNSYQDCILEYQVHVKEVK